MNPEEMMTQKVVLVCEDCGEKTDAKNRTTHIEEGWNWKEFEIEDAGIERIALCPDCFDSERMVQAVEEYMEERFDYEDPEKSHHNLTEFEK